MKIYITKYTHTCRSNFFIRIGQKKPVRSRKQFLSEMAYGTIQARGTSKTCYRRIQACDTSTRHVIVGYKHVTQVKGMLL
jgi:hypothetical protein